MQFRSPPKLARQYIGKSRPHSCTVYTSIYDMVSGRLHVCECALLIEYSHLNSISSWPKTMPPQNKRWNSVYVWSYVCVSVHTNMRGTFEATPKTVCARTRLPTKCAECSSRVGGAAIAVRQAARGRCCCWPNKCLYIYIYVFGWKTHKQAHKHVYMHIKVYATKRTRTQPYHTMIWRLKRVNERYIYYCAQSVMASITSIFGTYICNKGNTVNTNTFKWRKNTHSHTYRVSG